MACVFVKVIVSLCAVIANVGGQSLRGQSRRFGGAIGNLDASSQFQLSRQQQLSQLSPRILGSPTWAREGSVTSQLDQFSLQSPSSLSISPRTARLPRPHSVQVQGNLQTFQRLRDQQSQTLPESQQQRQQKLQQLQNNRILQRQTQHSKLLRAINGNSMQNQRIQMNTPNASPRIPLLAQQRRQRQQGISRDVPRLGFEENNLPSTRWNEQLPQGIMYSSPGSFTGGIQSRNANQQQLIWQQRRINNMLRRQEIEKHRAEQLSMQRRQQDEKMHRLLLQDQQLKQPWQIPIIQNSNGASNVAALKSQDATAQQAITSNTKADQAQAKQERIHQLAELLGFKPSDLFNVVAELEASKNSLATDALTVTSNKAKSSLISEATTVIPTVDVLTPGRVSTAVIDASKGGHVSLVPNNIIDANSIQSFNLVNGTSSVGITDAVQSGGNAFGPSTLTDPTVNRQLNQITPDVTSNRTVLNMGEILPVFDSGFSRVMGDNMIQTQRLRPEITEQLPILSQTELTNNVTSNPSITITGPTSPNYITNKISETYPVAVDLATESPLTSSSSNHTPGASMETHTAGKQMTDIHSAIEAQHLLQSLLGPMPPYTLLKDNSLSNATKALLMHIHNLISTSNKTVHIGSNVSNNHAVPNENRTQLNILNTIQPETGSINTIFHNATTLAPATVEMNRTDAWNITGDPMSDMNVTMPPLVTTTMEVNITTTAVTEATEAVPTPPPPAPGYPHMYEALPGQELTEAQLEYNEMREALMAK